MTKLEALAKDCIENHTHRLVDKPTKQDIYLREESIFIQGYRQAEKRIAELEKACDETQELLDKQIEVTYKLDKENTELKEKLSEVQMQKAGEKSDLVWKLKNANEQKKEKLNEAKDFIRNLIRVTWGEGWNYSLEWKVKAEQFLKEVSE